MLITAVDKCSRTHRPFGLRGSGLDFLRFFAGRPSLAPPAAAAGGSRPPVHPPAAAIGAAGPCHWCPPGRWNMPCCMPGDGTSVLCAFGKDARAFGDGCCGTNRGGLVGPAPGPWCPCPARAGGLGPPPGPGSAGGAAALPAFCSSHLAIAIWIASIRAGPRPYAPSGRRPRPPARTRGVWKRVQYSVACSPYCSLANAL